MLKNIKWIKSISISLLLCGTITIASPDTSDNYSAYASTFAGSSASEDKNHTDNTNESDNLEPTPTPKRPEIVTTPSEAKKLLQEGNERFLEEYIQRKLNVKLRKELAIKGQKPFAVIVSCSDSRVPPELIFDQTLGDLFVVRFAGNVVDKAGIGSIEYAVEHLGAPLVVVLGHEKCGAVKAAVDGGATSGNIGSIVNKIKPSLEKVRAISKTKAKLCENCENENIKNTITDIRKSPVIQNLENSGKISVIGAKYYLGSGKVFFTDGVE